MVLTTLGAVGFLNEVFIRGDQLAERVYILATCVALMGLPPILRLDERRRENDREEEG